MLLLQRGKSLYKILRGDSTVKRITTSHTTHAIDMTLKEIHILQSLGQLKFSQNTITLKFLGNLTTGTKTADLLTFALMDVPLRGSPPWSIIVERQALIAVWTRSIMLALTHSPPRAVQACGGDAFGSMAIALAPGADCHVRYGVEIRP